MLSRCLLVACALACLTRTARAEERPIVAVFDLTTDSKPHAKYTRKLTDFLRVKMAATKKVVVVDRGEQEAQLKAMLKEQRHASYKSCVDEACQIPLGKELAANKILRTRLAQFGKTLVLTGEMIDVATGGSAEAASVECEPNEASLLRAIDQLAKELTGGGPATVASSGDKQGFGQGLGPLAAVPTVDTFEGQLPANKLKDVDVAILRLLQTAKRADADANVDASKKAEAWGALAAHPDPNPLKADALQRKEAWLRVAEAEAKRALQLAKVLGQYREDEAKLKELLAFDDDVVSKEQKRAYQQEFDAAYAPWKKDIEARRAKIAVTKVLKYPGYKVSGIAHDGASTIWAADWSQGAGTRMIYALDADSGATRSTIPTPTDWTGGMVFADGHLWAVADSKLNRLDQSTGKVEVGIPTGRSQEYGYGLAFDGKNFWYAETYEIRVIDPKTQQNVLKINVPSGVHGLAFAGKNLWGGRDNKLVRLDAATGKDREVIVLPENSPGSIQAIGFDGKNLWLSMYGTSENIVQLEMWPRPDDPHRLGTP